MFPRRNAALPRNTPASNAFPARCAVMTGAVYAMIGNTRKNKEEK
jgi:hypothetical protein